MGFSPFPRRATVCLTVPLPPFSSRGRSEHGIPAFFEIDSMLGLSFLEGLFARRRFFPPPRREPPSFHASKHRSHLFFWRSALFTTHVSFSPLRLGGTLFFPFHQCQRLPTNEQCQGAPSLFSLPACRQTPLSSWDLFPSLFRSFPLLSINLSTSSLPYQFTALSFYSSWSTFPFLGLRRS